MEGLMHKHFGAILTWLVVFGTGTSQLASAQTVQAAAALNLPTAPIGTTTNPSVNIVHTQNTFSQQEWQMTFAGLPTGLDISNQTYFGWCADREGDYSHNVADHVAYTL